MGGIFKGAKSCHNTLCSSRETPTPGQGFFFRVGLSGCRDDRGSAPGLRASFGLPSRVSNTSTHINVSTQPPRTHPTRRVHYHPFGQKAVCGVESQTIPMSLTQLATTTTTHSPDDTNYPHTQKNIVDNQTRGQALLMQTRTAHLATLPPCNQMLRLAHLATLPPCHLATLVPDSGTNSALCTRSYAAWRESYLRRRERL